MKRKRKTPAWIERYKRDYEEGRITKEEIFKRENAEREANNKPLLKFKTVGRTLNMLGLSTISMKTEKKPPEVSPPPIKPCYGCRYYTKQSICVYPRSLFEVYPELSDFDRDFEEGRCKLKER